MQNSREWFEIIAAQQVCGAKLECEIAERLPKVGESSQKWYFFSHAHLSRLTVMKTREFGQNRQNPQQKQRK